MKFLSLLNIQITLDPYGLGRRGAEDNHVTQIADFFKFLKHYEFYFKITHWQFYKYDIKIPSQTRDLHS
jgi:hypothetical protein